MIVEMLEDLMDKSMARVCKKERQALQEMKKLEWRERWQALDTELAREMDILMSLVPEPMEVIVERDIVTGNMEGL